MSSKAIALVAVLGFLWVCLLSRNKKGVNYVKMDEPTVPDGNCNLYNGERRDDLQRDASVLARGEEMPVAEATVLSVTGQGEISLNYIIIINLNTPPNLRLTM